MQDPRPSSPNQERETPIVAVDLLLEYGYGLQVARGVGRYVSLHPELRFHRSVFSDIPQMYKGTVRAALGHFHEQPQWEVMERCGVPFVLSVSNRSDFAPWAKWIPDDREVGRVAARYFLSIPPFREVKRSTRPCRLRTKLRPPLRRTRDAQKAWRAGRGRRESGRQLCRNLPDRTPRSSVIPR